MDYVTLAKKQRFSQEKYQKVPLFASPRLSYDLYCLLPGQAQKVHTHDDQDKIYLVLEGEALFEIGGEQELLAAGTAVIARAGVSHGVRNEASGNLVLLVTMAPPPKVA